MFWVLVTVWALLHLPRFGTWVTKWSVIGRVSWATRWGFGRSDGLQKKRLCQAQSDQLLQIGMRRVKRMRQMWMTARRDRQQVGDPIRSGGWNYWNDGSAAAEDAEGAAAVDTGWNCPSSTQVCRGIDNLIVSRMFMLQRFVSQDF